MFRYIHESISKQTDPSRKVSLAIHATSPFTAGLLPASDAGERGRRRRGAAAAAAHDRLHPGLDVGRRQPIHLRLQEPPVPAGVHKGDYDTTVFIGYCD